MIFSKFYVKVEEHADHEYRFPYVELFVGVGFFLVYLVEELIGQCFTASNKKEKTNEMAELKRLFPVFIS